ncbi:MAG: GDYXXLXY domain-containing protein [Desulfovibrio sp.]|jgi:uncharacterized membrane protein/uncharacterized membrane-anchored protein|nr:GDYXXLXY domain-containing protein [Desulfovibrio sp.]
MANALTFTENGRASPLAWGLFGRLFCLFAGVLFFVAAIICFFAYNWAAMPVFVKFGCLIAPMIAAGAAAARREPDSACGSLALLACGLLAGPLLAVFGQAYQTGADAWELFRAWTLFLLPLAVISRRAGPWAALWLVGSLWAALYAQQETDLNPATSGLLCVITAGEIALFSLWELAARFCARPGFPFLRARWLPRCAGFALVVWLTFIVIDVILKRHGLRGYEGVYPLFYLYFTIAGAYWYTRKSRDLFLLACGLMSLICLVLALLYDGSGDEIAVLARMTLGLVACSAGAGKLLLHLHRQGKNGNTDAARSAPWAGRALQALCAWIAVPMIIVLMVLLFRGFSMDSLLTLCFIVLLSGVALSHAPGFFWGQASLCLSLTGALGAGVLSAMQWHVAPWYLLPLMACFAFTGPFSKSAAYRCIAAVMVIVLFFCQSFYLCVESAGRSEVFFFDDRMILVCYILYGVALARLWIQSPSAARTLPAAGFIALLLLGLLPFFFYRSSLLSDMMGYEPMFRAAGNPLSMVGTGAGIGLLAFAVLMRDTLSSRWIVRCGILIFCLALAVIGGMLPWIAVGLFALALARQKESNPLIGVAVLYLAGGTVFEYYCLATSLLYKSYSLGLVGLALMLSALLLHRALAAADGEKSPAASGASEREASAPGPFAAPPWDKAARVATAASLAVFLGFFAWSAYDKEMLLANGRVVILPLRPVDPRSLMQGDYMTLRFFLEDDIDRALRAADDWGESRKGRAVLTPDENNVYHFAALQGIAAQGIAAQAVSAKDALLAYRLRGGRRAQVCSGSFLFQEGHGKAYEKARFAEMRVDDEGVCLITHLLDGERKRIQSAGSAGIGNAE